jgi:hypothetical protein
MLTLNKLFLLSLLIISAPEAFAQVAVPKFNTPQGARCAHGVTEANRTCFAATLATHTPEEYRNAAKNCRYARNVQCGLACTGAAHAIASVLKSQPRPAPSAVIALEQDLELARATEQECDRVLLAEEAEKLDALASSYIEAKEQSFGTAAPARPSGRAPASVDSINRKSSSGI